MNDIGLAFYWKMNGWMAGGRFKGRMFFNRSRDADFEHAPLFSQLVGVVSARSVNMGWVSWETHVVSTIEACF